MCRERVNFVAGGYAFASAAGGVTMATCTALVMFVRAPILDPADEPWIKLLLNIAIHLIVFYLSASSGPFALAFLLCFRPAFSSLLVRYLAFAIASIMRRRPLSSQSWCT